ncbi:hypothetical protein SAMN05880501_11771 [Ureibacillus xyleni]|uniref:Uncharacterized protein n=1 Tax=Ureibacillus xyleni TaxID=614648 RepID=A0A285TP77_9BACL|nr:hypothetical protein [Ureibacillus xyleni]SOC24646.1 hypothetical protein SAMN05880501_11771 [Ureibacillus xyleni]
MDFKIKAFSYHSTTKNVFAVKVCDWGEYSIITKNGLIELLSDSGHSLLIGLDEDEQTNYCLTLCHDDKEVRLLFKLQPKSFFTLFDMYNKNKSQFFKEVQLINHGRLLIDRTNFIRQSDTLPQSTSTI